MKIVAVALQAGSGFGASESNADSVLQSTSSTRQLNRFLFVGVFLLRCSCIQANALLWCFRAQIVV